MDTEHLFVYGTLLPGLEPAHLVALVRKLGNGAEASVSGMLLDLGAYPGTVVDPSALVEPRPPSRRYRRFETVWRDARHFLPVPAHGTRVRGLVFELPAHPLFLRAFDDYEGFDTVQKTGQFERVLGSARLTDGTTVSTWIYGLSTSPTRARLIPGGDYLHR